MASSSKDGQTWIEQRDDSSRRTACDRCRGQKLRCERATDCAPPSANAPPPCHRCRRVGAHCTTTFPSQPQRKRSRNSSPLPPTPPDSTLSTSITMPMRVPESPAASFPPTPATMTASWDEYSVLADPNNRVDVWDGVQAASWAMNTAAVAQADPFMMSDPASTSSPSMPFHYGPSMIRQPSPMSHLPQVSQAEVFSPFSSIVQLLDELGRLSQALVQETDRAKAILSPSQYISQRHPDPNAGSEVRSLISRTFHLSESFIVILKNVAECWPLSDTVLSGPDGSMQVSPDVQTYHWAAMQIASLFTALTQLFGNIMIFVKDRLLDPGQSGMESHYYLPDFHIEGMGPLNSGNMQVYLFVEACVRLVELVHSRLRQIHDNGTLGVMGSSALRMAIGHHGSPVMSPSQSSFDMPPLSQATIRELHHGILARLQGTAY